MDANFQNDATNPSNGGATSPKPKKTKRVIEKLPLDLIKDLPDPIAAPEKKVEQDQYFLLLRRMLTGPLGIPVEISQCYEFAIQLDTAANAKSVGSVISIGVEKGCFEIVLKLTTNGQPANNAVPVNNAFALLKDELDAAPLLHQGSASWKAKVNGTTVAEGKFKSVAEGQSQ